MELLGGNISRVFISLLVLAIWVKFWIWTFCGYENTHFSSCFQFWGYVGDGGYFCVGCYLRIRAILNGLDLLWGELDG